MQVRVAMWLFEHATPQAPQLSGSTIGSDSQPSSCLLPLQSSYPDAHAPSQALLLQVTLAMWFDEQARPQPPQLDGSVEVNVSQPFAPLLPSQFEVPLAHAPEHTPTAHAGTGTLLFEQLRPQPPQFDGLP